MPISRRHLLMSGGAAATAWSLPKLAIAETIVGDMTIQTVSDGSLTLPTDLVFAPVPAPLGQQVRSQFGLSDDGLTPPCNLALVRHGDNIVLFDAGSGHGFQPSAGQLVNSLDALGLAVEDITHVVFTHAHPDHLWGVLDDFDDPLFYEAEHMIGQVEFDYWMDPKTIDTIGDARQAFVAGATRRLEMLKDQLTFFSDGDEILPGIAAVQSFGHTPGHMAFEVRSGSESVMIVGDAIGNHHIALAHPDTPIGSDQDQEQGAATRRQLIDRITSEQMRVVGFHLPDGGLGRIDASGDGYVFVAEPD